ARTRPARLLPAVCGALSAHATVSDGGRSPPRRSRPRAHAGDARQPGRGDRVYRVGIRAVRVGGGVVVGARVAPGRAADHVARATRAYVRPPLRAVGRGPATEAAPGPGPL